MSILIGNKVRVRDGEVVGKVTGYFVGMRSLGYRRISNPSENNTSWPTWYEVEYDSPVWDGDIMRGYKPTLRRGMHTEDNLISV